MADFVLSFLKFGTNAVREFFSDEEIRSGKTGKSKQIRKDERYEEYLKLCNVPGVDNDIELAYFSLNECVRDLSSNNVNLKKKALKKLKINISRDGSRLINAAISAGVLFHLKQLLLNCDNEFLQCEAASTLKLISSGTETHVRAVIDAGYEKILYTLLRSKYDDVAEEAVWTLGALIPFCMVMKRDRYKVALGIARMPLLSEPSLPLLRAITWTMSGLEQPVKETTTTNLKIFIPIIVQLLISAGNDDALKLVLRDLTSPSDIFSVDENIKNVVRSEEIVKQVVNFLYEDDTGLVLLSLRAVSIITRGNYRLSTALIENNVLSALGELLNHPEGIVQREALKCLDRISNQSLKKSKAIIGNGLVPLLLCLITRESEDMVKLSALEILLKVTNRSKPEESTYFRDIGTLQVLCQVLKDPCKEQVVKSLSVLQTLLEMAKMNQQFILTLSIVKTHCLDTIKAYQENGYPYNSLSYYVNSFAEKYFTSEPVEEENQVDDDDFSDDDLMFDGQYQYQDNFEQDDAGEEDDNQMDQEDSQDEEYYTSSDDELNICQNAEDDEQGQDVD